MANINDVRLVSISSVEGNPYLNICVVKEFWMTCGRKHLGKDLRSVDWMAFVHRILFLYFVFAFFLHKKSLCLRSAQYERTIVPQGLVRNTNDPRSVLDLGQAFESVIPHPYGHLCVANQASSRQLGHFQLALLAERTLYPFRQRRNGGCSRPMTQFKFVSLRKSHRRIFLQKRLANDSVSFSRHA